MGERNRRRRHEEAGVAAEHRGDGRAAAGGRQVPHLHVAGRLGKQRGRDVRGAVEARRAEDQLVGIGLGILHQLLERLVGQLGVDDHHDRIGDDARERDEIGIGELRLAAEQLVHRGEAGDRDQMRQQGIPVRLCRHDELRTDRACRTGLVLENERLLEHRLQRGVERPSYGVADAAGRKRIDDGDGTRWVDILRADASRPLSTCHYACADEEAASVHGVSSLDDQPCAGMLVACAV